jgi:hypothetical protein
MTRESLRVAVPALLLGVVVGVPSGASRGESMESPRRRHATAKPRRDREGADGAPTRGRASAGGRAATAEGARPHGEAQRGQGVRVHRAPAVRRGAYKGSSRFDAYVTGEYGDTYNYFGTADERFQFEKCMAERGIVLSK